MLPVLTLKPGGPDAPAPFTVSIQVLFDPSTTRVVDGLVSYTGGSALIRVMDESNLTGTKRDDARKLLGWCMENWAPKNPERGENGLYYAWETDFDTFSKGAMNAVISNNTPGLKSSPYSLVHYSQRKTDTEDGQYMMWTFRVTHKKT